MKQLVFVRHAIAVDREKAKGRGLADRDRPLTAKGIRDFKLHVLKNKKVFKKVDLWVTSPYIRARETLDVILEALRIDEAHVHIVTRLVPSARPQKLTDTIKKTNERNIVFVSHEPFLSRFLRHVLPKEENLPGLKKGAVIVVDYQEKNNKFKLKSVNNP